MSASSPDPYRILGVPPSASDEELRTAYRRLVQLHHPDHNHGSRESALRFAEVQEAYAHAKLLRKQAAATTGTRATGSSTHSSDPDLEARLAAMEQELRTARQRREQAARAAAQEAAHATRRASQTRGAEETEASDEELGIYTTDDSFTKILDDFADQVASRFSEAHPPSGSQAGQRRPRSVTDWIDELGSRLTGDAHRRPKDD